MQNTWQAYKFLLPLLWTLNLILLSGYFEQEKFFDKASIKPDEQPKIKALPAIGIIEHPKQYRNKEVHVFGRVIGGLAFEKEIRIMLGQASLTTCTFFKGEST